MAVLGILTCEILELDWAYLLTTDPQVARVAVLEDRRSARLIQALEARGFQNLERIPHIRAWRSEPALPLEIVVRVLDLALHRSCKMLQRALVEAARELRPYVDALLLGYGTCGNARVDVRELLDVNIPVFVPMDRESPVDDCVALFIGGRDCYYAEQCRIPGTFFMTTGWTYHWKGILEGNLPGAIQAATKRMFSHYERSLLILTPVVERAEMEHNVAEFNQIFGLRVETRQGTMQLLTEAWDSAKSFLTGPSVARPFERHR